MAAAPSVPKYEGRSELGCRYNNPNCRGGLLLPDWDHDDLLGGKLHGAVRRCDCWARRNAVRVALRAGETTTFSERMPRFDERPYSDIDPRVIEQIRKWLAQQLRDSWSRTGQNLWLQTDSPKIADDLAILVHEQLLEKGVGSVRLTERSLLRRALRSIARTDALYDGRIDLQTPFPGRSELRRPKPRPGDRHDESTQAPYRKPTLLEVVDDLVRAEVLVLSGFDRTTDRMGMSAWGRETLMLVVDARWRDERPTALISHSDDVIERVGSYNASRLTSGLSAFVGGFSDEDSGLERLRARAESTRRASQARDAGPDS